MTAIHAAASAGFAAEAGTYARGRPDYPPELQDWLRGTLGLAPGRHVIDVGAGTGKFTVLLTQTGAEVIAVEPVEAMRSQLVAALPDVAVRAGTAEALPLPSASADALVCAQAFHWFATPAALADIHRVLVPDGVLGLIWNVRDESVDWVRELTDIVSPYEGDAPRFRTGRWRAPFDGSLFTPLEQVTFHHEHVGHPDTVIIDRFMSVSFIAALPSMEKQRVQARLQTLINDHPTLRGREVVAFPYSTEAYWSRRRES